MAKREDAKRRARRRNKVEERKGTEWYENASQEGLQDPTKGGRYSGAEVKAEYRSGRGDRSVDETSSYYQGLVNSGEAKFNSRAKKFLSNKHGVTFPGSNQEEPATEPKEESTTESAERYKNKAVSSAVDSQRQSVGNSNGDVNNNYYEGNTSNITLAGSVGDQNDTSMTKLSIAQASNPNPTDSGKGGADWVNYWKDVGTSKGANEAADRINSQAQQEADSLSILDTSVINTQLNKSTQNSYDRAKLGKIETFGDIYNKGYKPPSFENSAPSEVEQPDFEKMYNDLKKNIK